MQAPFRIPTLRHSGSRGASPSRTHNLIWSTVLTPERPSGNSSERFDAALRQSALLQRLSAFILMKTASKNAVQKHSQKRSHSWLLRALALRTARLLCRIVGTLRLHQLPCNCNVYRARVYTRVGGTLPWEGAFFSARKQVEIGEEISLHTFRFTVALLSATSSRGPGLTLNCGFPITSRQCCACRMS